ncbi:hypothetical protein [Methylobacterium brachiatum]|uniref:hypothetical protein n=1 Tax=Methylobacterium brachiatum TaxID=269660 RepID=UPI0008F128E9|nr:hypothetical protein [Methylobacterium brachiatum]SFJ67253.1 hypothetical protein SAMN02799642_05115 [Methylobacterium brachiatum]
MVCRLGDVQPGRVWVDCASCKRSGRYSVATLLERYGPNISSIDLLRTLTASCQYQRLPGSPPARKYEHLCLAAITLPQPIRPETPVPPGRPYTIEVWGERGAIEAQLAVIYPLDMALAAFELACGQWPTREVTLRDRCRIVRKQEPVTPGQPG